MNNNSKEKLILASLAKIIAERDETIYKIQSLLDSNFDDNRGDVDLLKTYFEKLSSQELVIDTIQVFFARHFKSELPKKQKENDNDNPS